MRYINLLVVVVVVVVACVVPQCKILAMRLAVFVTVSPCLIQVTRYFVPCSEHDEVYRKHVKILMEDVIVMENYETTAFIRSACEH